jgi:hypothetical protein
MMNTSTVVGTRALARILILLSALLAWGLLGARSARADRPPVCDDPNNRTHCELSLDEPGCRPTRAYLNYVGDDFRDPYGDPINPNTWINVRNQPYRRYGPRGVRVFYQGKWGFVSGNCLSGGL